jgi:hypothetical protein
VEFTFSWDWSSVVAARNVATEVLFGVTAVEGARCAILLHAAITNLQLHQQLATMNDEALQGPHARTQTYTSVKSRQLIGMLLPLLLLL